MYLSLLRTSMDNRCDELSHPAFAHIIGQLTANEAKVLKGILDANNVQPLIQIIRVLSTGGYIVEYNNLAQFTNRMLS